ncbi:hypothetical protein HID58_090455 [Brassica napus]|uniref:Seven-in-absentia protein TRAF-like domain-containing protein n=1 Tax=Brassica napus TaxID=3708 RepID=A0ABQ7X1N6_BRANA|nr:hypothetical protein HID58_090455 [Brassica napus]
MENLNMHIAKTSMAPVYMAKKFSYSLEVGAHSCKLTWQGIPRSIRDGHRKVRHTWRDENEAKKFSYSLEVGAHSCKLTWQGIPRSIRDGHRKVRHSQYRREE